MHESDQEESAQKKSEESQSGTPRLSLVWLQEKRKVRRTALSELYVNGNFTEDRGRWQRELQRHCEEVYSDQAETTEVQEKRIQYFKNKVDQQFMDDGRAADITIDLVLQARAKMSGNNANGPVQL